jgi:hypothetical protein
MGFNSAFKGLSIPLFLFRQLLLTLSSWLGFVFLLEDGIFTDRFAELRNRKQRQNQDMFWSCEAK